MNMKKVKKFGLIFSIAVVLLAVCWISFPSPYKKEYSKMCVSSEVDENSVVFHLRRKPLNVMEWRFEESSRKNNGDSEVAPPSKGFVAMKEWLFNAVPDDSNPRGKSGMYATYKVKGTPCEVELLVDTSRTTMNRIGGLNGDEVFFMTVNGLPYRTRGEPYIPFDDGFGPMGYADDQDDAPIPIISNDN